MGSCESCLGCATGFAIAGALGHSLCEVKSEIGRVADAIGCLSRHMQSLEAVLSRPDEPAADVLLKIT